MGMGHTEPVSAMEDSMTLERARLVRLCTHLTGDRHIAEDLAQETLLEAWRNAHKLRDPDKRPQWLAGIARNVCSSSARSRGRDLPRLAHPDDPENTADDLDVEIELERDELARLLDRALELLPPMTRDILVERYLRESSHAEIAERMGLSEGAVSMRLTRGRLLLRRAITTGLRDEAEAYGFSNSMSDEWRETRIWCHQCGQRKLMARVPQAPGTVSFRCPACHPAPDTVGSEYRLANAHFACLVGDLVQPQSILNRVTAWAHDYYMQALMVGVVACTNCGRPTRLHMHLPTKVPDRTGDLRGVHARCEACGEYVSSSAKGLITSLPEVQRFRRDHFRIRTLTDHEIDAAGQAAVVTRFEAVASSARLDVVSLRDTFQVIGIYGNQEPRSER